MAMRLIASYGEDVVDASQTELHEAVDRDENTTSTHELQGIITKYPWTVDQWNHEGHTPLTLASKNGNLYAARELVRLGCNIDQPDYEGNTPLMLASSNGHVDVVRYLLDAGCSVTATSICGDTALHHAVSNDSAEENGNIMQMLLSAGVSAKTACLRGHTPLHDIGRSSYEKLTRGASMRMIRLLLEAGADIDAMNNLTERPLFRAFFNNQPEVIKCLIEAGAQVTYMLWKESLLHVAAKVARLEALKCLADIPLPLMNVYQEDDCGDTPWDDFIMVMYRPGWDLGSWRRPTSQEQDAFVTLYKKVRDQSLELDISRLQRIRQCLEDDILHGAMAVLQSLVSEKRDWEQWEVVQTYETIRLQVRQQMIEAALESVDENIEVLQEKIDASPWDQVSHWDPPETEGSDDLEDDTESKWIETEDDAGARRIE